MGVFRKGDRKLEVIRPYVIIPGLAEIAGTSPPPGSPLSQADRAYKTAIADLARQASLGIQTRSVTNSRSRPAPQATRNPT